MNRHPIEGLSDEELDRYIQARLDMAGVDLSVLPENEPTAPADRAGIFRSARNFLRTTVPTLSRYELDPQQFPPILYPSALPENEEEGE